jgi:hypothetical protein
MLKEFYAISTANELYHVVESRDGNGNPCAIVKIVFSKKAKRTVEKVFLGGPMLAIANWLVAYVPKGNGVASLERRFEKVNPDYWVDATPPIAALFRDKRKALACFRIENLKPHDPRWLEETRKVVRAIGTEHPVFEVCRDPFLGLLPA